MIKLNLTIAFVASFFFSFCQNWTGNVSSDWNNSANWSQWPLNGEDITIDPLNYTGASASPILSANSVFSPAAVLITNGANVTINANLSTTDNVECVGVNSNLTFNSGTFNVNIGGGGRLIIDLGATMLMTGGTLNVDERFIAGEDATVTINAGTASSGERWLMDLGGRFIQNGGTANCAATFAMADGSVNRPSSYILNSGNLNLTGEFAIENESGTFYPFFEQNGGNFTLNGDMFWLGTAPGAGRGYFRMNGGTATVIGIIQNMLGSTMNMQMEFNNSSVFNFNGTLWESQLVSDSLIQTGSSTINVNSLTATFINPGIIKSISGDLNLNANTSFTGTGSFQWDNVTVNANGSFVHTTANPISISGHFTNNGGYSPLSGNSWLIFNGIDQQIYGGSQFLPAVNVTVNKAGGDLLLNQSIEISNYLYLTTGNITSSAANIVRILNNASSDNGNSSSFVNGPLEKVGDVGFVFPIGKNGVLAQLLMTTPIGAGTNDVFRAEYYNNAYSNLSPVNSPLSGVSGLEYWNFEQLIGNSTPKVGLYWHDAIASSIMDCNELSVAQWNGNSWDNHLSTVTGTCGTGGDGFITTNAIITNPGIFTFGFYSGVTSQSFTICNGESVQVGTNVYTTSGTYIDQLQDINMNDSIVITSLTVITVDPSVQMNGTALQAVNTNATTYNWIDCNTGMTTGVTTANFTPTQDGIYSLIVGENTCVDTSNCTYYVMIETTVCQGEGYTIGTNTYINSGIFSEMLLASNLLDSAVVLNLNVTAVDTAISLSGITLSSINATATSFQWIDCTTGPIVGETSSSYSAAYNGSFALIVEENGCTDTSACYAITTVGLDEFDLTTLIVYPNPSNGTFNVTGAFDKGIVTLCSMSGEMIHRSAITAGEIISLDASKGIYLMTLSLDNGQTSIQKIIIE